MYAFCAKFVILSVFFPNLYFYDFNLPIARQELFEIFEYRKWGKYKKL